ncbi:MAG TPA: SpoIIE family protein phosphatase [Thermomicrobiaceae bacterium]|nr:SpoIIE family protein phosphatase [Thermomicrobiaceae bacterium]
MPVMIDLAVAKTTKFGTRESGDTVEIVERPGGGFSAVIVDGQGSGGAAKLLSLLVAGRAMSLLNEGVRDGAAARATHDFLYATRGGRVSAALDIVSVDLLSRSLLFTRNSEVPMLLHREGCWQCVADSGGRIGIYRHTRPRVLEHPLEPGLIAVVVTDGVAVAGGRFGPVMALPAIAEAAATDFTASADLADRILREAMVADRGRPADDMTVVVLRLASETSAQPIRRLTVAVPLAD